MTSSGTYDFELSNADVILEAFDRCEIRPPAITGEHMISAKRSLNLELQTWSNLGVNLWCVDLITIPLAQGVVEYDLPSNVVSMLDVYIRTFTVSTPYNFTPNFSTTMGSLVVRIEISNHGLMAGNWINITTPISISNLLLYSIYEVVSVIDTNIFTIAVGTPAAATVTSGGALPIFSIAAGQNVANVYLPNNNYQIGDQFNVAAQTLVGGVILVGDCLVTGVTDANNFGIATNQTASYSDTQTENYGLAQILGQNGGVDPVDTIMTPFGRTDYAMIPDKLMQGKPTTYWMNRQIDPTVTLWQAPDNYGPYELKAYVMRRVQDASPTMGQTPNVPYRFYDAFCARMAERLAMKYAKEMLPVLSPAAKKVWDEAQIEDRERADIMIIPDLSGYYQD